MSFPLHVHRARRGTVIVPALGMLLLGAGLIAGGALASTEFTRATRAALGRVRADAEARRVLGEAVQRWDARADSLAIGAELDLDVPVALAGGPSLVSTARLRRRTEALYTIAVTVRVGTAARLIARRDVRLHLARAAAGIDSGAAAGTLPARVPRILSRWSIIEPR